MIGPAAQRWTRIEPYLAPLRHPCAVPFLIRERTEYAYLLDHAARRIASKGPGPQ